MLLPAADYNVYRGGTRLPAGDGARPPIGASPGELRLWMKLHGELDKDKLAEETRIPARNRTLALTLTLTLTLALTLALTLTLTLTLALALTTRCLGAAGRAAVGGDGHAHPGKG